MDRDQNQSGPDYVFVQTIVVQSVRRTSLWERALGKGQMVEVPRAVRSYTPSQPRLMGQLDPRSITGPASQVVLPEVRRQVTGISGPSLREKRRSSDFWINALAISTLAAFLLSLYFLH